MGNTIDTRSPAPADIKALAAKWVKSQDGGDALTSEEWSRLRAWLLEHMTACAEECEREGSMTIVRGRVLTRLAQRLGWEESEKIVERVFMCSAAGWPGEVRMDA